MTKKLLLMVMLLAPMTIFAQKFGFFNSQEVIPLMTEYIQAQKELQTLSKQYQDDITRMQTEGNKKVAEYKKEQANLPENIRQRREEELQELSQRIEQSVTSNRQALQDESSKKMDFINKKVLKSVGEIGKLGGYTLIFDKNSGIPYMSESLCTDVTAQLKKKLGISTAVATPAATTGDTAK